MEQKSLDFLAKDVIDTRGANNLIVTYGRILRKSDKTYISISTDVKQFYYVVELPNGKTILARPFQDSIKGIKYNQPMLIVKDTFTKDYVFQPTITTGKDFGPVKEE